MLKIGVGKATGGPVLRYDDVAFLHLEVVVKGAAPLPLAKA
jgi:hypothetical protein